MMLRFCGRMIATGNWFDCVFRSQSRRRSLVAHCGTCAGIERAHYANAGAIDRSRTGLVRHAQVDPAHSTVVRWILSRDQIVLLTNAGVIQRSTRTPARRCGPRTSAIRIIRASARRRTKSSSRSSMVRRSICSIAARGQIVNEHSAGTARPAAGRHLAKTMCMRRCCRVASKDIRSTIRKRRLGSIKRMADAFVRPLATPR